MTDYVDAVRSGDEASISAVKARVETSGQEIRDARTNLKDHIAEMAGAASMKDSDYVFIHFILNELPIGLIGLLVAVILCAAMSSTASELSALATISTVDF